MTRLDPVLDLIDSRIDADIDSLLELMAIPSISSDPEAAQGVRDAAIWLDRALADMGFTSRVVETAGHPVVLASSADGPADGPRLLFYGHYDVQPVGDLADWSHPPFAPRIIEESGLRRIYGRGASDSKSQLWSFVQGLRAWREVNGGFPGPVTILLEGEEEAGSYSLPAFIDAHRDELACDVAFICDSEMWSHSQPALTLQLKGLVHERVTIRGPNPDLHSGHWGAVAINPVRVLANLLAGLHDDTGRVSIAGFYNGVQDIPPALRSAWAELAREPGVIDSNDLTGGIVEQGFTPIEAMWGRPTVDINGVTAGNQGPGERSVLPSSATARLSFRLVAGQEPETIRAQFRAHVQAHIPIGCSVEFEGQSGSAASALDPDNRFNRAAARGLQAEWGRDVVLKGSGGAIPLVQEFSARLGVDCVLIGFILGEDAIHAPDERYDATRFHKSVRAWARILAEIEAMA